MSSPEPPEPTSQEVTKARYTPSQPSASDGQQKSNREEPDTDRPLTRNARRFSATPGEPIPQMDGTSREIPFAHMRVHFEDFAMQLRLHRHHEHRKRILSHRRNRLQNAVALSARLHRVSSWVHDGLVEITQQADASGFTRLHQHTHDLVDLCFSHWNHEIQGQDPVYTSNASVKEPFLSQLPPSAQQDCLEFIQTLRNNPRFLVERFKAMSPAQISSLSTSPKFQELSESVLTSLSQNRGRASVRKRVKAYSKDLEDYASSFERSNPLSFLLHNIYAPYQDVESPESKLRFATWSTICSSLMVESAHASDALMGQVLSMFASLYEWQIKDRLELFLMSVLQRGAFLIDIVENSAAGPPSNLGILNTFNTPQAHEFFDESVRELFEILSCEGGMPIGALHLGRAIIGKLPTVELQSQFRGHLFFQWFLKHFLRITIGYPEDEKMLLQFHISDRARSHLLHQLWDRACSRATDTVSPMRAQPVDPVIQNYVLAMISQLEADEHCFDPYQGSRSPNDPTAPCDPPFLSICAADVAHVLEALSPQFIHTSSPYDSFLSSSHSIFRMQYSHASSKFNNLRRRILAVIEPGHSSKNIHPCHENWAQLSISPAGVLSAVVPDGASEVTMRMEELGNLHLAEEAAFRLVEGRLRSDRGQVFDIIPSTRSKASSLAEMFAAEARSAHIKTDSVTALYWQDALAFLRRHYPLTVLTEDDTKVLGPITEKLRNGQMQIALDCQKLEEEVAQLETLYNFATARISKLSVWLDKIRVKLWYKMDVVSSGAYEDAKNIATALNNMALSKLQGYVPSQRGANSPEASRPGTSDTSASSLFEQPRIDTMSLLKAPAEHGGPRKLADAQIELINKWLERNHVDNFCKGEERIHRFCMEVKMAIKKLVGETLSESPVLWSSDLFTRERNLFDIHANTGFSAQPSTRSASVWSEPLSSSSFPSRTGFFGSRASFFSQGSSRLGRDLLGSDLASLISSPGRATTVTTLESGSSVWSPPQSNPRSVTSASSLSRPGSMLEDHGWNRLTDHNRQKANFLDQLQQDLVCLLLSDLGCPVWSCGSETDAWMDTMRQTASIVERLEQRAVLARLHRNADSRRSAVTSDSRASMKRWGRSQSADANSQQAPGHGRTADAHPFESLLNFEGSRTDAGEFSYHSAFSDVLSRVQKHVDPHSKLKAIYDFKTLSQAFHKSRRYLPPAGNEISRVDGVNSEELLRRRSLNPSVLSANLSRHEGKDVKTRPFQTDNEDNLTTLLKQLLFALQPKTIFRDLQYVAAFVSSQTLADTEVGRAFLHVGLAALAWKDEVCRGMVDVADRIVVRDSIKRDARGRERNEPSILKAMDYWLIAAREGNAIAQRELASLYLTHPEVPPIVSLPLALSSEIFKSEMMWEEHEGSRRCRQSLCLALHWMQQAAQNGDTVAQTKLKERRANRSLQ
ncbi:hypothetical protein A1O3_00372 [Capronia epimyces CBS 606.96]|uniref:Uncharacterized protein n=1 Tax=Capronia epimyces CBS 606.96 TaxID=1182542 RepID=W9YG11_9EURO|nr:uncharacterized protein A1O3_00372 [Capronia epimyces CBS 606.96]EXJ91822.1 hypothetical protein A1O3_00372 [Capronia epimyces CBS 606.96]